MEDTQFDGVIVSLLIFPHGGPMLLLLVKKFMSVVVTVLVLNQKMYSCSYHLLEDTWRTLPQPGVYYAVPVSTGGELTLIGGRDTIGYKFSAKLPTFDDSTQSWIKQFPDLLIARSRPGVAVCSSYLIVAGGKLKSKGQLSNKVEFLDLKESPLRWKNPL